MMDGRIVANDVLKPYGLESEWSNAQPIRRGTARLLDANSGVVLGYPEIALRSVTCYWKAGFSSQ